MENMKEKFQNALLQHGLSNLQVFSALFVVLIPNPWNIIPLIVLLFGNKIVILGGDKK